MAEYPSNNPYKQWAAAPSQSQYPAAPQSSYPPPEGPPPGSSTQQGYTQLPPQGAPPGYQPSPSDYPQDKKASGEYVPHQQGSPYTAAASAPGNIPVYDYGPVGDSPMPHGERASSSGPNGNGGLSLASFFGDKGPPPSWQRPPAPHMTYNQFPPMCLISNGKELTKGFPELPPPCQLAPHPFSTHDVNEDDWKRRVCKRSGPLRMLNASQILGRYEERCFPDPWTTYQVQRYPSRCWIELHRYDRSLYQGVYPCNTQPQEGSS